MFAKLGETPFPRLIQEKFGTGGGAFLARHSL